MQGNNCVKQIPAAAAQPGPSNSKDGKKSFWSFGKGKEKPYGPVTKEEHDKKAAAAEETKKALEKAGFL